MLISCKLSCFYCVAVCSASLHYLPPDNHCRNSTYETATLGMTIACVGVFWWELPIIMQSWGNCVLFHALDIWFTCSFRILTALQVVRGTALRSAREYACVCCVIELQRECWPGIGEAVGSWERPLCLLVHSCTETSHCEVWPVLGEVIVLHFSHLLFCCPAQSRTREREESGFSLMNTHRNSLRRRASQLATTAFHEPEPFPSNLHECYQVTHYSHQQLKGRSECTAGMAALLSCCNVVQTWVVREWQWDFLWEWVKYWL